MQTKEMRCCGAASSSERPAVAAVRLGHLRPLHGLHKCHEHRTLNHRVVRDKEVRHLQHIWCVPALAHIFIDSDALGCMRIDEILQVARNGLDVVQ